MYVPVDLELVVGISEEPAKALMVYPIPAKGFINIQMAEGIHSVRLLNSFGQMVTEKTFYGETTASLDLQQYISGIYTLQITNGPGKTLNRNIILSR
jgi:hypothetical protein